VSVIAIPGAPRHRGGVPNIFGAGYYNPGVASSLSALLFPAAIQPFVKRVAGPEMRQTLCRNGNDFSGARITSCAGAANAREIAKIADAIEGTAVNKNILQFTVA